MKPVITLAAMLALCGATETGATGAEHIGYGPRPLFLVERMSDGPLKEKLLSCKGQTPKRTEFSIGHRGAPLMFPEHTVESNVAAARMGAGILECDVTFTKDKQLVCRHAQNDLQRTTNIVTSDLAHTCVTQFQPAANGEPAQAECRTSDITLTEFRTLSPKMDARNPAAETPQQYLGGTANWRTDLFVDGTQMMTHAESIALFKSLGAKFMPELKSASVEMPFDGFSQADYAQKLVDEYKAAGISPSDVYLQSFDYNDILYWIENEPEFGAQAVWLDNQYRNAGFNNMDPNSWAFQMSDIKADGVNYLAPPLWFLVTLDNGTIVPSAYAKAARAAGLKLITWTLERSGPLASGGGWYYQTIADVTNNDGAVYDLLHVLAQDVQVEGVFSDWPATVTYYANCMGL